MENKPTLEIEFNQNLKNFVPEIAVRIIYLIFSYVILKNSGDAFSQSYFIASLFISFNFILFLLTLYGTNRRKISITRFIETRLKAHDQYKKCKIIYTSDFQKTPFYLIVGVSAFLFTWSIFMVSLFLKLDQNDNSIINALIIIVSPIFYSIITYYYRMNFISKGIVAVTNNDEKFSKEKVEEFMSLLYDDQEEIDLHYMNDGFIYDIEKKANIFKQRVETLLIEAVFIGALTFGTFIELTSPDSISSFDQIHDKELKLNETKNISKFQDSHNIDKDSIYRYLMNSLNQTTINSALNQTKWSNKKTSKNYSANHFSKTKKENGIFKDWAVQRQYTILSYIYKTIYSKNENHSDVILLIDSSFAKDENSNLEYEISDIKKRLLSLTKSYIRKDKLDTLYAINKSIESKLAKDLILYSDQSNLLKLAGKNPFNVTQENREKIKRILWKNDFDKFMKYVCITKKSWDEQEYLFLIAIGSIICSVLYISVLIKRFAVIMRIEGLFSELNKAMVWNRREEDALSNEMRTEVEGGNNVVLEKFINKRKYYSEKLQIQLAKCELLCTKIETNIQVLSFIRNLGLGIFFLVLMIGTMMLDPRFTIVLASILLYALIGSAFMQEGSNLSSFWQVISGSMSSKNIKDVD